LQELHRVLKPGAQVAVLDFNNTDDQFVDWFQGFSLENIVVPAAKLYGLAEEYEYLRPSIKRFATGLFTCSVSHVFPWSDTRPTDLQSLVCEVLVERKIMHHVLTSMVTLVQVSNRRTLQDKLGLPRQPIMRLDLD